MAKVCAVCFVVWEEVSVVEEGGSEQTAVSEGVGATVLWAEVAEEASAAASAWARL